MPTLQDDATSELESARLELKEAGGEGLDSALRQEVDRLRDELRRSEDNLGETEAALEKQTRTLETTTRRVRPRRARPKV